MVYHRRRYGRFSIIGFLGTLYFSRIDIKDLRRKHRDGPINESSSYAIPDSFIADRLGEMIDQRIPAPGLSR